MKDCFVPFRAADIFSRGTGIATEWLMNKKDRITYTYQYK